jgi:pseudouridine-5'-phosphate glycosidase|tara:strand:- start:74 stop:982 length:909 start_codon:yes stop_codon:yes gene_type:complete
LKYQVKTSEEVQDALDTGTAVVALESTIFSNLGLPSPSNEEALNRCIRAVREEGAVPALTAVLDGELCAGVSPDTHERILGSTTKVAARDLSTSVAKKLSVGATTVSASLAIASALGIEVFATGGIGGVHRGADITGDISADLLAISNYPVLVVSAGAKSFLDLPKTLEYLETLSVPVLGWKTDFFPAFYLRSSGLRVSSRLDDVTEVAIVHRTRTNLRHGGTLLGVPIPTGAEIDPSLVAEALEIALDEVEKLCLKGPEITPVVLASIAKATDGQSIPANLALAENNATVAAQVAVALLSV